MTVQDRSLEAVQDRPLGAAAQGVAWAGLAQEPLGMLDMRASQVVGFPLGVDTFHKEGQAAGQEGAAQSHQVGLEGRHPQELQDTGLACWLLQMSQTCWLPAKYTEQSLRLTGPEVLTPCLSTLPYGVLQWL